MLLSVHINIKVILSNNEKHKPGSCCKCCKIVSDFLSPCLVAASKAIDWSEGGVIFTQSQHATYHHKFVMINVNGLVIRRSH